MLCSRFCIPQLAVVLAAWVICLSGDVALEAADKPNIIFILADDLGYGDLGCYGQKLIETPNLDRMAAEGLRFTDFYAGNTVCAPSRSVLMTGQHMGHTHVRGNAGADISIQSLRDEDVTVAEVLKQAGYATALCGKWGLGESVPGNTGLPNDQGFDLFYGYLNQVHAHNYYPEFLWLNKQKQPLRNKVVTLPRKYAGFAGGYATERVDYSHDLILEQALDFVEAQKDGQFFLYLPLTIPHANNEGTRGTGDGQEVPDYGIYKDRPWDNPDKGQAAMITRMDAGIGQLLALLKKLKIDDNTLVMFSSDNGHHDEGGHNTDLFDPNGPLRGMKRDLYEGGIRVPFIARWPGTITAGKNSAHSSGFQDIFPTLCDLAGIKAPGTDGISLAPLLTGKGKQRKHPHLYWEFYERGGRRAVVKGNLKAVQINMMRDPNAPIEVYDLSKDLGEENNVASKHQSFIKEVKGIMKREHRD